MFHEVSLHGILWKHFLTLRTRDSLICQSLEMDVKLDNAKKSKPGQEFLVLLAALLSSCASQCAFSMCLGAVAFHIQGMGPERESYKSVECSFKNMRTFFFVETGFGGGMAKLGFSAKSFA